MAAFKSSPYAIELYSAGAVDPTRFQVTFVKRSGDTALVAGGETAYTTGARSCTCVDFTLQGNVCAHMKARDRAFRKFARDYRLKVSEPPRPLWAEDIRD